MFQAQKEMKRLSLNKFQRLGKIQSPKEEKKFKLEKHFKFKRRKKC